MEAVTVSFDRETNTLTVWFGNPMSEEYSREVDEDTVLMIDRTGKVIGVEKLNYTPDPQAAEVRVAFSSS